MKNSKTCCRGAPMVSPFGEVAWGAAHTPLLFQRIGGIATDDPLLTVAQTNRAG